MTNAEKFLKDGVDKRELFEKICLVFYDGGYSDFDVLKLEKFFNEQAKPELTVDEIVILKNIDKKYKYIRRSEGDAELFLKEEADDTCSYIFRGYKHLFKFIKEGEKYQIEELLNNANS